MQIVVLIPLTHPSCMTGQPAHCLCIWRIPVQIRLSVSSAGWESSFWTAHVAKNCNYLGKQHSNYIHTWKPHGVFADRLLRVPIIAGKKKKNVRLRTSRFLYNLLNICSWSKEMAKVKFGDFFPVGISLYILKPKNCCLFSNAFLVAVKYSL